VALLDRERPLIAGVIYNRLKLGMQLGIDATLLYDDPTPDGQLSTSDLETDTPYNTRIRTGLPPTPIASPGIKSLEAASPTAAGLTVTGTTPGSFDAGFVSQTLLRQMLFELVHAEVVKRKLTANDACRLECVGVDPDHAVRKHLWRRPVAAREVAAVRCAPAHEQERPDGSPHADDDGHDRPTEG